MFINELSEIENYTVIDFETSGVNIKTCEIIEMSAVKVRNNEIVDTYTTLIKPDHEISSIITEITGITNSMLKNAPKIEDKLNEFLDFIGNDIIVGHNINSYDIPILRRYCDKLNHSFVIYDKVDTLQFARCCNIDVPNYKLTTLTEYFGIEHDAHRALGDCVANHKCYKALKPLFNSKNKNSYFKKARRFNEVNLTEESKAMKELAQIVDIIQSIGTVSNEEFNDFFEWMEKHKNISQKYPFDVIFEILNNFCKNNTDTIEERYNLIDALTECINPIENKYEKTEEIILDNKQVCLTGDFVNCSKDEMTQKLESLGAIVKKAVSGKTDYVIVGGNGSDQWSCGNYGSKVKKALELQAKGNDIKIIKEEDLFKCLTERV